jgi:hypothetical protein
MPVALHLPRSHAAILVLAGRVPVRAVLETALLVVKTEIVRPVYAINFQSVVPESGLRSAGLLRRMNAMCSAYVHPRAENVVRHILPVVVRFLLVLNVFV